MSYEYHQLLECVYFEGYANSYEEAEYILEQLSNEEFDELYENVFRSRNTGAVSADADERAAEMHKTVADASHTSPENRKGHRDAAAQHLVSARRKRRKAKTNEECVIDYLVTEGYTDNYDSAIAIYESMSEEWLDTILEVKGRGRVPFTGNTTDRGMAINPSDKLYRKKIKIEMDMEDEEDRIRAKNRAKPANRDSGPHPEEEDDDDTRSRKSRRKVARRDAAANREMGTSSRMQRLRQRHQTLSNVDDRLRYGR